MTEEALYSTWGAFQDMYYNDIDYCDEATDFYLFVCKTCERITEGLPKLSTPDEIKLLVFKTLHEGNFNPRGYFSELSTCEALRDVFDSSNINNFRLNLAVYRAFKAYKDGKTIFQL